MLGQGESYTLTDQERQILLTLVTDSIAARLSDESLPEPPENAPALQRLASVFVTLRESSGDLRGCMGDMSGSRPLGKAVQHAALTSAFNDPRFPPLVAAELPHIDVEISVLSPLQRIEEYDDIEIGRHGLVIRARGQVGLLLPQVASSRNWNREQFLAAICRKARLPEDYWRQNDGALYVFTADIFSNFVD